jgi:hypothetical protein
MQRAFRVCIDRISNCGRQNVSSLPSMMPAAGRLRWNRIEERSIGHGFNFLQFDSPLSTLFCTTSFPFGAFPHTGRIAQKYESLWLKVVPRGGKACCSLELRDYNLYELQR